jgi:hypothetical protein
LVGQPSPVECGRAFKNGAGEHPPAIEVYRGRRDTGGWIGLIAIGRFADEPRALFKTSGMLLDYDAASLQVFVS